MLRVLILAMLLVLMSTTSAGADDATGASDPSDVFHLRIGGALALVQSAVRATLPGAATHRTVNGRTWPERRPWPERERDGSRPALALVNPGGDKPALAYPVTRSMSLGLGYRWLREEDLHLEAAKAGALDGGYSSHNVVLRARWRF